MRYQPQLECLESRLVLASSVRLTGGTLFLQGDNAANVLSAQLNPADATQILTNVDGFRQTFAASAVQRVVIDGQGGADILTSQVNTVPDVLFGGDGADTLQAFGTSSVVLGGSGQDTIYAIVGAGAFLDGGQGRDRIIGNATSIINNDAADRPNVVFGVATRPIQLIGNVLYFVGTAGNDVATVVEQAGTVSVTFNGVGLNFNSRDVSTVATLLGAGDDSIDSRFSPVPVVAYGTGGNDTLLGGRGDDLLKGGGGNDRVIGGDGDDDLTGDSGADIVMGGNGQNILRIDAMDMFLAGQRDKVVSIAA